MGPDVPTPVWPCVAKSMLWCVVVLEKNLRPGSHFDGHNVQVQVKVDHQMGISVVLPHFAAGWWWPGASLAQARSWQGQG